MTRFLIGSAAATALLGCASPTTMPASIGNGTNITDARITSEAEFRERVVGRELVAEFEDGTAEFTISGDGTLEGTYTPTGASEPSNVLEGTWSWQDDLWCREVDGTTTDFPYECQQVLVEDGFYWNIRPDGSEGARYRIT